MDIDASQSLNRAAANEQQSSSVRSPGAAQSRNATIKPAIAKRKGSIFKSRVLVPSAGKANGDQRLVASKRHLYKHSWNENHKPLESCLRKNEPAATNGVTACSNGADVYDDFGAEIGSSYGVELKSTRFGKPGAYDISAVRNVKTAHQIQEIGEYQEMHDDVEYILDALQPHNPASTRSLAALQLATKCMTPAFRMHVRAHGIVSKFFKALADANQQLSLALCTSAIMFILSQEGLNMDLDRDSLALMIHLLEAERIAEAADRINYERNLLKVRELCEELKVQRKALHLKVDEINVGTLAMETLLTLTSKRAACAWFKEELRKLGGLAHLIKTITTQAPTADLTWTSAAIESMQTVARCLRVLENVTHHNESNQNYLLTYDNGAAINTLCEIYRLCDYHLQQSTSADQSCAAMLAVLIPVIKVLINITHSFSDSPLLCLGAQTLGQRADIRITSLRLLLLAGNYMPEDSVYELNILVLTLLINLTIHDATNRVAIMRTEAPNEYIPANSDSSRPVLAVQAILEYIYQCLELAKLVEQNTDAFLESCEQTKKKPDEVDDAANHLMQRAGHHMEHTLKASYAAILVGHLISDNEEHENLARTHLHNNSFEELIAGLEKYQTFMNLTASSEASVVAHMKSTKQVIAYLKKRQYLHEHERDDDKGASSSNTNLPTTSSASSISRI